jgi:hypothetical protein
MNNDQKVIVTRLLLIAATLGTIGYIRLTVKPTIVLLPPAQPQVITDFVVGVQPKVSSSPVVAPAVTSTPPINATSNGLSGGMMASAEGPVGLEVTDPDGFTITPTTTVSSTEEYLREIPGVFYYSEMEMGKYNLPIVQVYSYKLKPGDYKIKVIYDFLKAANSSTVQANAYWLDFSTLTEVVNLASATLISQIPPQGYRIHVNQDGSVISH